MKQLRFLQALLYGFGLSFIFFSCNSGNTSDEKAIADTTMADTSAAMVTPAEAPAVSAGDVMVIKHKVANYDKWKPAYDSHDSMRNANGLHNYVLGRGMADPSIVMVILKMDDVNKAKAFTESQDLKDKMKQGGVTGKPEIEYINRVMIDTANTDQKARLRVTHKVKDWDAWKKSFDSHKQARIDAGLIDRSVGRSIDDNHMVSLVFVVTDKKKADDFIKSKDLKDKMAEAGVEGPPTFFYYNVVERY